MPFHLFQSVSRSLIILRNSSGDTQLKLWGAEDSDPYGIVRLNLALPSMSAAPLLSKGLRSVPSEPKAYNSFIGVPPASRSGG